MSGGSRRHSLLSGVPHRSWPDGMIHHVTRWLLLALLAVGLVILYPSDPGVGIGRHTAGTVADRDIIAQVGFPVPRDSAELRRERGEAAASVIPTFNYAESGRDSALAALGNFFARIDSVAVVDGVAGISSVLSASAIEASAADVEILADTGRAASLHDLAAAAITTLTPDGVMAPGAASRLTTDSIRVVRGGRATVVARSSVLSGRDFYDRALTGQEPGPETDLLRLVLARYLAPTLVPDELRIGRDIEAARDMVPIMEARVLEGEAIVRANDQVSDATLRKLEAYRAQLRLEGISVDSSNLGGAVGGLLLNVLLLTVLGVLILFFRPDIYRSFRSLVAIAGIFALYFVGAFVMTGLGLPPAALPIVFVAVSLSILWDGRFALLAVFVLCALTAVQEPFTEVPVAIVLLAGGSAAALSVRTFRRLSQTWVFIAVTAGAYSLVILGFQMQGESSAGLLPLAWALLTTITGAILAIGFVPVFEWVTGITTDQTLIGWADTNRPLMRRLAAEAPGTFAHTMQAANMAEAGAGEVGANALLCRAGVYYHDVGKMARPGFFIENQHGENPHDRLPPDESAAVVRDHVVEGVRMAKRERVPEILVDFIREHHGDQSISFFLQRAREEAEKEGRDLPDADHFRYPGPRPRSRETAIAMLADSSESAARALDNPTEERIEQLIEGIFAAKAKGGQLDDCTLTFQDLARLKRRFVRFLGGSHHRRIAYPGTKHLTRGATGGDGDDR